ncbi:MAG: GNAT family N-acetyltransferase [Chloroflexota bacterium]
MTYQIRQSTSADTALIAHHRSLMFADQGDYLDSDLAAMEIQYAVWVAPKLASGDYIGWFAETDLGEIVAGVGLWLREWPPILDDETGKQGYLENVYTVPAHRRQGLSRQLMHALLAWVHETRVTQNIALHAAPIAQPLYESLGFISESGLMLLWID